MKEVYEGWIMGDPKREEKLRDLGVTILEGPDLNNAGLAVWTCEVPVKVMEKLDSYWGVFVWHLTLKEAEDD